MKYTDGNILVFQCNDDSFYIGYSSKSDSLNFNIARNLSNRSNWKYKAFAIRPKKFLGTIKVPLFNQDAYYKMAGMLEIPEDFYKGHSYYECVIYSYYIKRLAKTDEPELRKLITPPTDKQMVIIKAMLKNMNKKIS